MRNVVNLIGPLCKDISDVNLDLQTILIDGATKWKGQFKNSISVGDGDSIEDKHLFKLDYLYPSEKDETDLKLALMHLKESYPFDEIMIYGLLGGRLDHELANFFELNHFLLEFEQKILHLYAENKECHFYSKGSYEIDYKGTFSLLSFQSGHIILTGDVKYPILSEEDASRLPLSGLGISNYSYGQIKLVQNIPTLYFPVEKSS